MPCGGAPEERLELSAAPRGAVQATRTCRRQVARARRRTPAIGRAARRPRSRRGARAAAAPAARAGDADARPIPARFGSELGSFSRYEFADRQRARVAGLAPEIEAVATGRETTISVRIGPFAGTAQADAALAQVIRAGVTDARIVVE